MTEAQKIVLVVDDEPDTLDFLTTVLEDNGYATVSARDGAEAMTELEARVPDLVTLDITMPKRSGVAVYRMLREEGRLQSVPVIIVTGISDDFEPFISTRRQVPPPDGYIHKPVDHEKLMDLVRESIG